MLLTFRRAENRRVDLFLATIRATAVPAPVRPLPVRATPPAGVRTDTVTLPRIVATAGAQL